MAPHRQVATGREGGWGAVGAGEFSILWESQRPSVAPSIRVSSRASGVEIRQRSLVLVQSQQFGWERFSGGDWVGGLGLEATLQRTAG